MFAANTIKGVICLTFLPQFRRYKGNGLEGAPNADDLIAPDKIELFMGI